MEGGPYFLFSARIYLRPWKERFNPKSKDLTVAMVWIHLVGLPSEYQDMDILRDIGNSVGEFVKVS